MLGQVVIRNIKILTADCGRGGWLALPAIGTKQQTYETVENESGATGEADTTAAHATDEADESGRIY